ncbi:biotin transporter BioY [Bartonella krasnovii]|uniref:Biotin transporter n=1 Tax=Bartonella krasnovii TaxID=2267275 RepID=A0A5B9CZE2_9HYPH|nr:biotin transporter BioY [Bartonella krasnovii]QEE11608.1 biotin transporter BioY [Bartonella krasnovii]UNF29364.1 biotin transporter BioY [Bartonella krasnovii]UNF35721.1 biotin transporter BioY [Bartonella krasnovii]UNF37341.1 biotin transporter BioY [Bartonella krasnovii]UNF39074.1 biotin transporter BioY [Bartonella krasnovii]
MNTKDLAYVALFAAIYAVLGLFPPIHLPFLLGVPITAQSMGPMLAGSILGAKRGALASLLFLVLVAIGLPLLPGGRGGISVFAGIASGYLIGFPFAAFFIGLMVELFWQRLNLITLFVINAVGGIGVVYAFGVPWTAYMTKISLLKALIASSVFLIGDSLKVLIASFVALAIKKSVPLIYKKKE